MLILAWKLHPTNHITSTTTIRLWNEFYREKNIAHRRGEAGARRRRAAAFGWSGACFQARWHQERSKSTLGCFEGMLAPPDDNIMYIAKITKR